MEMIMDMDRENDTDMGIKPRQKHEDGNDSVSNLECARLSHRVW